NVFATDPTVQNALEALAGRDDARLRVVASPGNERQPMSQSPDTGAAPIANGVVGANESAAAPSGNGTGQRPSREEGELPSTTGKQRRGVFGGWWPFGRRT